MISSAKNSPHDAFPAFLEHDLNTELLRFTTAGSVDDGKSTLIGRLLHHSKAVYEAQLAAVNKLDLVEYREDGFLRLQDDFLELAAQLGIANVQCVPISALEGDNVVDRSKRMPWYQGPTLLEHLETVPLPENDSLQSFRFPVQTEIRPDA